MESNKFWNLLTQAISLPFDIENVEDINENCDSTYIELKDGSSYYITIEKCEE